MDATNQRPGDAFQGPSQELPSIEVCAHQDNVWLEGRILRCKNSDGLQKAHETCVRNRDFILASSLPEIIY